MLEMVLATNNVGKQREFEQMLSALPVRLVPQSQLNIPVVAETGATFIENALLKARHAAAFTGMPAIADDSGLVVDALGGRPGIYSARYAGPDADDVARINKLLQELDGVAEAHRLASFYCVTVLLESENDPAPLICEGVWDGSIMTAPVGTGGFGYDPVFWVAEKNCSAAQLTADEKNQFSHRGQALAQLLEAMEQMA